jgi:cyclopropane fatty-acyl-phospholipid synthase-like methyltransferase
VLAPDRRHRSPSTARNRAPILAVLERVLPAGAHVLEIASGAGEHAVFVARAMPHLLWQPSDPDAESRASIVSWIAHENLSNVLAPLAIDVRADDWGVEGAFDAIVAINMIHIAPWDAALGLLGGAGRTLRSGGVLYLYGPFLREGQHTAPSNAAFDLWLKERDPAFGVRDLAQVVEAASAQGLSLTDVTDMPANNFSVVFTKTRTAGCPDGR